MNWTITSIRLLSTISGQWAPSKVTFPPLVPGIWGFPFLEGNILSTQVRFPILWAKKNMFKNYACHFLTQYQTSLFIPAGDSEDRWQLRSTMLKFTRASVSFSGNFRTSPTWAEAAIVRWCCYMVPTVQEEEAGREGIILRRSSSPLAMPWYKAQHRQLKTLQLRLQQSKL